MAAVCWYPLPFGIWLLLASQNTPTSPAVRRGETLCQSRSFSLVTCARLGLALEFARSPLTDGLFANNVPSDILCIRAGVQYLGTVGIVPVTVCAQAWSCTETAHSFPFHQPVRQPWSARSSLPLFCTLPVAQISQLAFLTQH